MTLRAAALAATAAVAAGRAAPAQRYTAPAAVIAPVPMGASCQPEAAAQVDTGAAWLLVRALEPARAAFDRAVDRDPDCALGYWGQALARFDDADAGSGPAVAAIDTAIVRGTSVPRRTAFEQAALAAMERLRGREAAPGVPAAWPARVSAYRDALCGSAPLDPRARLWCARALADHARLAAGAGAASAHAPETLALQHVGDLVREAPMDVGAAVIVLEVAPDPRAPIVGRALDAVAAANPPAPVPHALAARVAVRRGDWRAVLTAAERASAAGVGGADAGDVADAQIEALLQIGRRADAYATASRLLPPGAEAAPADIARAARAVARVAIGDRRLDARGLGDRSRLPGDARMAAEWPIVFAAGLDAALRAWPAGDDARVAEARAAIAGLDARGPAAGASEIAWARTVIGAAIAASQDEHPDQMLHLAHAADLERALVASGRVRVPLVPVRELAAELWLRTYRYDDARREARAVLDAVPTRIAPHVVLARTAVRLEDTAAAVDLWRRIIDLRAGADADDTVRLEARQAIGQ